MNTFLNNWRYVFAIIFLNLADFFLTRELLATGEVIEANPFMFWLIEAGSIWSILWFKASACGALLVLSFFGPLNEKLLHFTIWVYMTVVIYSIFLTQIT